MYCEKCGAAIPEGTRFCTKCGEPVGGGAPMPSQGNRGGGSTGSKIVIVVSIVVIVVAAVILAWVFMSPQSTGSADESGSSTSSVVSSGSPENSSGTSSEPSSGSVVSRETTTWFGSVTDADGKVSVSSFEGLEGSFVDDRGGATEYHGFYTSLRLSNAKVESDGLSGTCEIQMSWVPHTDESVNGGVAQFKGTMTFKYDPANPDALICSAQGDSFSGKATITKDKFQWTEGWMNPGYTHDPNETVDLTRGFKREG